VIFTALGIWLALKLSKPKIETLVVEKEVYVTRPGNFILNTSLISQLELSKRELEILPVRLIVTLISSLILKRKVVLPYN
ncbi:MAG: helix-turn-helix transcriptional regulator, partial [Segetibacter sp.]|nr:helix-turn-helix transcriptional regulator [Segetibacter sp.]